MSLKTPLGAARGLGSAKSGTHHWIVQRITAIALVPLTIWFVFAAIGLAGGGYAEDAAAAGEAAGEAAQRRSRGDAPAACGERCGCGGVTR